MPAEPVSEVTLRESRRLGLSLGVIGAGVVALTVTADSLFSNPGRGFGALQATMVVAGLGLVGAGILVWSYPRSCRDAGPQFERFNAHRILGTAVWFGLVAGVPDLMTAGFRHVLGQPVLGVTTHAVWLAPLPNLSIFLATALALLALSRIRPGVLAVMPAVGAFAFLFFLSVSLAFEGVLHIAALLVLSGGVAYQVARFASRFRPLAARLVRTTAWPLVFLWSVTASVSLLGPSISDRWTRGRLPPASSQDASVLLIILDTVRAQNSSLNSYSRPTMPHLERLATRGVTFESAFSTAPWTLPSHGSMFTGLYPHDLSGDWDEPLERSPVTLAEFLSRRGYATGAFVANRLYAARGSGLERGFSRYDSDVVSFSEAVGSAPLTRHLADIPIVRRLVGSEEILGRKGGAQVTREFLNWLDTLGEQPFFAFLNYYDAHDPYLPPSPYRERFDSGAGGCTAEHLTAATPKRTDTMMGCVDAYDASIAYLDARLDILFGELDRRALLDETIVIVTSDHGEEFGEHGVVNHGRSLYRPSVQVPLLLVASGNDAVPPGTRISDVVSLRDLPATVLELLGLPPSFPGRSLARTWRSVEGDEPADPREERPGWVATETSARTFLRPHNPASRGHMLSLIARGQRYILNGDDTEELYDFVGDPGETENLVARADHHDLEWFRETIRPLARKYDRRH